MVIKLFSYYILLLFFLKAQRSYKRRQVSLNLIACHNHRFNILYDYTDISISPLPNRASTHVHVARCCSSLFTICSERQQRGSLWLVNFAHWIGYRAGDYCLPLSATCGVFDGRERERERVCVCLAIIWPYTDVMMWKEYGAVRKGRNISVGGFFEGTQALCL